MARPPSAPRTVLGYLIQQRNQTYEEVAAEFQRLPEGIPISARHLSRLARNEREGVSLTPATKRALLALFGLPAEDLLRPWDESSDRQVLTGDKARSDEQPAADSGLDLGSTPFVVSSQLELDEIIFHLREQWHALVRADNLLGPRHAITGVRSQLAVLADLMATTRGDIRDVIVKLSAQYAESASWLCEDAGDMAEALTWTGRALEWAYEADDTTMLAWTAFRRSQQSTALGDAAKSVALARAARRNEEAIATPMRAATRVQEAKGHAMDKDERTALLLLDEAHRWAADDNVGEARGGHGSFCTASYIEVQRAACLTLLGHPDRAIAVYEEALPLVPPVYRRDRAAALAGKATAHVAASQPEEAAAAAREALPIARRAGSQRIISQLTVVAGRLTPHQRLPAVAALLDDLGEVH